MCLFVFVFLVFQFSFSPSYCWSERQQNNDKMYSVIPCFVFLYSQERFSLSQRHVGKMSKYFLQIFHHSTHPYVCIIFRFFLSFFLFLFVNQVNFCFCKTETQKLSLSVANLGHFRRGKTEKFVVTIVGKCAENGKRSISFINSLSQVL